MRYAMLLCLAAGVTGCTTDHQRPDTGAVQDGGADHTVTYPPLDVSIIGAPVEIGNQFLFTEGPVWDPKKQVLYFTDINADAIYRLTLPGTLDVLLQPAGNPDGLALDPQGRLLVAGFVSRNVWRLDGTTRTVLSDSYQGKKLNSPDDLIARSDGVVYFTDPVFGINGTQGFAKQAQELTFEGVFRVTPNGVVHLEDPLPSLPDAAVPDGAAKPSRDAAVLDGAALDASAQDGAARDGAAPPSSDAGVKSPHPGPNGVQLSPDEHTLYVSYTLTGEIYAFAVAVDGALSNKKLFATTSLPDSMCVDAAGNLYVASGEGGGGIVVFDPAGTKLGIIPVPEIPTNAAFGGADQKTFFITARKALVGTPTAGNSSLYRIDAMPIPGLPGQP